MKPETKVQKRQHQLKQLGAEIARVSKLKTKRITVSGPTGLCARYWVTIETRGWERTIAFEFVPGRKHPGIRDYTVPSSKEFKTDSIGARNGLNKPFIKPPVKNPGAAWYAQYVGRATRPL